MEKLLVHLRTKRNFEAGFVVSATTSKVLERANVEFRCCVRMLGSSHCLPYEWRWPQILMIKGTGWERTSPLRAFTKTTTTTSTTTTATTTTTTTNNDNNDNNDNKRQRQQRQRQRQQTQTRTRTQTQTQTQTIISTSHNLIVHFCNEKLSHNLATHNSISQSHNSNPQQRTIHNPLQQANNYLATHNALGRAAMSERTVMKRRCKENR